MTNLNVGVIGLGVGMKQARAFAAHPHCAVTHVCDFDEKKLADVCNLLPNCRISTDADKLLQDESLDVVSVASYDNYHYSQVLMALQSRKHVFVEKPLCLHREEAVDIYEYLSRNPSLRLSSNLNLRTCPRFINLRESVQAGDTGEIFYVEGDYLWGRIGKLTDGWRKDMDYYSIIHGAAVHVIDLIVWILGVCPVRVYATGNQIATQGTEFRYNDFAVLLLEFENGMIAKIASSGGCVHPHFHRLTVYGKKSTFIHDITGVKWIMSADGEEKLRDVEGDYPAWERKGLLIASFVDSILDSGQQPLVSSQDVFQTMSICYSAERSMVEKQPVLINYIGEKEKD